MKNNKKRVGTKARIKAVKDRERRMVTVIFLALILLIMIISAYFTYTYLNQPISHAINPSFPFKAAIVDHLSLSFPNQTFIEKATSTLKQAGYTVDYYLGEQVTVDFYRSLLAKGYGLLILRVHSAPFEEDKGVFYFTSQLYRKTQYVHEQLSEQVKIATPGMTGEELFSGNFSKYFAIGPEFIKQTVHTKLGNTTLIAMGCDGLTYTTMAQAFTEKGAKAYISWNGPVLANHTDQATTLLLQHLILDKQTIKQAVKDTMKEVGPDPEYKSQLTYYPTKAGYETIEDIKSNY